MADDTIRDNRERNDELTRERRLKADKTMGENRARNDGMTANRRGIKDRNVNVALTIFLLIAIVLAIGILFNVM